jgi:hypothetical protein
LIGINFFFFTELNLNFWLNNVDQFSEMEWTISEIGHVRRIRHHLRLDPLRRQMVHRAHQRSKYSGNFIRNYLRYWVAYQMTSLNSSFNIM